MKHKTTQRDFEMFKRGFTAASNRLGLVDWDITFIHKKIDEDTIAEVSRDTAGRVASATLNKVIEAPKKPNYTSAGRHEAIHIFLGNIVHLAKRRFITEADIDIEEEKLAIVLEKVL